MSSKQPKPVLTGQRLKSRKRDEKEKFEPEVFRDEIVSGINECEDLDAVAKYLDVTGNKLNYRRYSETLFDCLFAGAILAPGGSIEDDGAPMTKFNVFAADDSYDGVKPYMDLLNKVLRRYKFLQKAFQEELGKLMKFLKGFTDSNRHKLGVAMGLCLAQGLAQGEVLLELRTEQQLKEGLALDFITVVFRSWVDNASMDSVNLTLRKGGVADRLLDFLPLAQRNRETFNSHFEKAGLSEIVKYQRQKETAQIKTEMGRWIKMHMEEEGGVPEMIVELKEFVAKNELSEFDAVSVVFANIMAGGPDWNKKADLVQGQALLHIKQYASVLGTFTTELKSEITLLIRIQNYCFDNQQFLKAYKNIVVLLYKADVVGEDAILKWYHGNHSTKGKSAFNEQMLSMVEWLQSAEEESSDEDEE